MADNLDPETLRQLNESMREMRETVSGMVPAMVLMTAAMTENMNATKGNSNSTKNSKRIVDDFIKSQQEATAATESRAKTDEEMAKVQANYKMAATQAVDSLKKLSNGLLTAGGDMTKYGGAVSSAGDAAMSIGKNFGVLGLAVGGLIKLFSMGAEMVLKQNSAMLKSADILADFGATGSLTTKELLTMANAAGYSSGEMEKFAGITKGLGTDIIGLSATVTGGVKAFAELATMDETLLSNYRAMGVTQEQLNKNQADYIKLQIKSGMAISERDKQDGTLKRTTLEYTNYLMDLSAITGLTVDEAKKAQEVARNDLAVQTRLAMLQDKEEKLRSRGIAEGNKEMIVQADAMKAERERTGALMDFAGTFMKGEELAGFQSMVATGNFNELSAGFASGAPEILEFIDAVKKGKKEPYELSLMMAQATKRTRENLGEAVIQNKEVGKSFAYSLAALENEAKFRGKNPEEIKKIIEEERKVRDKALKEGTTDPAKAARNAQEQAERRARLGADAIVSLLNGPVTSAFEKLMKVMGGLAKGIAHFAKWLGGPDFTSMFETSEDIAEKQQQNAIALDKTLAEIEKAKSAISDPAKYKQSLEDQRKLADAEVKTKTDLFRDLKKQASEEKDIAKKALIEKQAEEASKAVGEATRKKQQADIEAQNARNRTDDRIKKDAQEKLLSLEKKKIELTTEENKLDEEQIKKQLEQGKITPKEAEEKRNYKTTVTKEQGQIAASQAELAGNQSSSESKRLGLSKGSEESATPLQGNSKEFYNKMYNTLLEEAKKAKIANPEAIARLGASQSALETGYGKHTAGGNNYFGIKGSKTNSGNEVSTQEFDPKTGKMVTIKDSFRKYDSMEESAADYIKFLQENKRYKQVLASKNAEEAISAQGKTGYATDPNYTSKLALIDKRGQVAVNQSAQSEKVAATQSPQSEKVATTQPAQPTQREKVAVNQPVQSEKVAVAQPTQTEKRENVDPSTLPNQAAEGGIFSGPNTGYPVAMHGSELVAPLDPNSIIAKMLTSTPEQSRQLANEKTIEQPSTPENNGLNLEVFTMLAEKLDEMINILNTSNDTQEQLLKYSRV